NVSVARAGTFTVNPLVSAPAPSPGLVTITSRGPAVVLPSITNDAVRRAEDTNATLLTVMPAPALTVAPFANPLPSIVTGTVVPEVPWLGVTALTVTAEVVAVVTAWADDPSANATVTVSVVPVRNPWPPP